MKITRVNLSTELAQREGGRLLAFGSIDFDEVLRVESIRVVKTHDGRILVCMPSKVNSAGQHKDVVHPLNSLLREMINDVIYEELRMKV